MTITRPYYRNCRQFKDSTYADSGQSQYILDPRYVCVSLDFEHDQEFERSVPDEFTVFRMFEMQRIG